MCVTNIAKRRNAAVVNATAMVSSTPSLLSQRLMGNFMPLMLNNSIAKPLPGTNSTCNNVGEPSRIPTQTSPLNTSFFSESSLCSVTGDFESDDKSRPKRRRKPQKPGKTAKLNDRHFVVHNYHDHALDPDENDEDDDAHRKGGASISFPTKLHNVLEQVEADGLAHIVSWQPHGRCFLIHKPKEFADHVMPHYFRQSKLTSFQRQLNLYGFSRLTRGKDSGGYYHEMFLRGKVALTKKMMRTKIKGTKFKAASSPDQEPDFYTMPFVKSFAPVSDDSSADGSAVLGRRTPPMRFTPGTDFLQTLPNPVSPSTAPFEPLPMQMPQTHMVPSLEPYPIANGISKSNTIASTFNGLQFPFDLASLSRMNQADDILDEAVDELFNDVNDGVELDQSGDFDRLWDTSEFGEDSRQDDLQLGFMLDRLLQN